MWNLIQSHPYVSGGLAMWIVGNAVSAMPSPHEKGSAFYEWFFKFMQPIGAALPRLMAIYSPNTLNALTGQSPKLTVPPNPPISEPPTPLEVKP